MAYFYFAFLAMKLQVLVSGGLLLLLHYTQTAILQSFSSGVPDSPKLAVLIFHEICMGPITVNI